ncbi:MAG TPA: tetratricopeptide repeat protein [Bacteroidia bacterium]|nr:tetratricopeptide repeat protein [Bacteroidia bacterium]
MKKIIFLFLFLLIGLFERSAAMPNDSLYASWLNKSLPDTIRVKRLQVFSFRILNIYADSAEKLAFEGLAFLKKIHRKKEEPHFLNTIGACNFYKGNTAKALDYYNRSVKAFWELGDTLSSGAILTNVAGIYYILGEHEQAITNFKKGLSYIDTTKEKNFPRLAMIYTNMASNYSVMKLNDEAIQCYHRATHFALASHDTTSYANALTQMVAFYINNNRIKEAGETLEKVNPYYNKLNYKLVDLYIDMNNGGYLSLLNEHKKAIPYYYKALKTSIEINYTDARIDIYHALFNAYKGLKQSDSALFHHMNYVHWKDSLKNQEIKEKIMRAGMNEEYKAQKAIDDKEAQLQIQKAKEKEKIQMIIAWSSVIVLLLVIAFAFLISNRLKITRRQKNEIERQKVVIEGKQKEILDSLHYAKRIQNSLLSNEKYIDRILKKLKGKA